LDKGTIIFARTHFEFPYIDNLQDNEYTNKEVEKEATFYKCDNGVLTTINFQDIN
jgi:hypothetical protein